MNEFAEYRILIADDEKDILNMLGEILRMEGFVNIYGAGSCREALSITEKMSPALILLDVMLPDGSGFYLYERIRSVSQAPVIFITARGEAEDKIRGLGLGADDYIVKPFLSRELGLRIMAVMRRTYGKAESNGIVRLRDRSINFETASVVKNGKEIPLTAKEYLLLRKLYENKNKIVTNDSLCMTAWGDSYYGYENTLMVHIRHLRKKTEADPSKPEHIITARGLGYRLVIDDE